jgi:hypothetical protein
MAWSGTRPRLRKQRILRVGPLQPEPSMTDTSSTGRFWLCPQCRRHVPIRTDVCQCGSDRGKLTAKAEEVGLRTLPEKAPHSRGLLVALAVVLACGGLLYVGLRGFIKQEASEPTSSRMPRVREQPPQVIYVPVPVSAAPPVSPLQPEAVPTPPVVAPDSPQPQPQVIVAQPPALAVPTLATPDPGIELERRYRMQLSLAKSNADSLRFAADKDCPELRSGEQRLPEAVSQCLRIRADADQAVATYEMLRQDALRAGFLIR